MEIYDFSWWRIENNHLKKLNEMKENTYRQPNEIVWTVHKQIERFNKETETMKKSQTEIMGLKNIIREPKISVEGSNKRLDHAGERISEL